MKKEDLSLLYDTGNLFREYFIENYYKTYANQMTFLQSRRFDYLINNENVTAKELCEKFELPKQHISNIVKKLENDGFVKKQPGADKRYNILIVTEKGRQEYIRHLSESEKYSSNLLDQIEDIDDFLSSLEKVNSYLKQIKK